VELPTDTLSSWTNLSSKYYFEISLSLPADAAFSGSRFFLGVLFQAFSRERRLMVEQVFLGEEKASIAPSPRTPSPRPHEPFGKGCHHFSIFDSNGAILELVSSRDSSVLPSKCLKGKVFSEPRVRVSFSTTRIPLF